MVVVYVGFTSRRGVPEAQAHVPVIASHCFRSLVHVQLFMQFTPQVPSEHSKQAELVVKPQS